MPSKQPDPLPNAALEAAASGCCVVASDHGGLPEIVRDGETGLLVRPDDPDALAAAIAGADARAPRRRRGRRRRAALRARAHARARSRRLYDTLLS